MPRVAVLLRKLRVSAGESISANILAPAMSSHPCWRLFWTAGLTPVERWNQLSPVGIRPAARPRRDADGVVARGPGEVRDGDGDLDLRGADAGVTAGWRGASTTVGIPPDAIGLLPAISWQRVVPLLVVAGAWAGACGGDSSATDSIADHFAWAQARLRAVTHGSVGVSESGARQQPRADASESGGRKDRWP